MPVHPYVHSVRVPNLGNKVYENPRLVQKFPRAK